MKSRLNENNCVTTIQPHTLNSTMCYYRTKKSIELGVSLLYSFKNYQKKYTVVGDACADIMIHFDENKEQFAMDLVGPHDHLEKLKLKEGHTYFGIRFLPGYSPKATGMELADVMGTSVPMMKNALYDSLIESLRGSDYYLEQCQNVMECIFDFQKSEKNESGQTILNNSILDCILSSQKSMTMKELEEYSGYSSRYLSKVFHDRTGYSIIQFSNVLRAQRVCNYIDQFTKEGMPPQFDEIALELGYSDQSHMIREFKKHIGMTPRQYYKNFRWKYAG